jgi:hypothetical protein
VADQDTQGKHPGGRPTTFTPDVLRYTEEYFETYEAWYESPVETQDKQGNVTTRMERHPNPPPSVLDLHRYLKNKGLTVSRWSLYDWCDLGKPSEIPEFSQIIKKAAERLYPEVLQENAIMGRYSNPFAIFAAKNRMGWHDKQEVDHTHKVEPLILQTLDGKPLITLGSGVGNKAS